MLAGGQYWNITSYYLVFAAFDLILAYAGYRSWRDHVSSWKANGKPWQQLLLVIALLLMLFATLVWAFLSFFTWDSWRTSLNPGVSKPPFLIVWLIGFFAYGISNAFSRALNAFVGRE